MQFSLRVLQPKYLTLMLLILFLGSILLELLKPSLASPVQPDETHFGLEINQGYVRSLGGQAQAAGVSWIRYNGILWSEVEKTPGQRDWAKLAPIEAELRLLGEQGITPIVVVRGTPAWAQTISGAVCGPIKSEALPLFADFMRELVERYRNPPYNIRYWELWNEPDVDSRFISDLKTNPFGCWGNQDELWYGGGEYAAMLKEVYPVIKKVAPEVQVVLGGLMLDCDPARHSLLGKECRAGNFLEGVLKNGGGKAFDLLAYHSYAYWNGATNDWDRKDPNWQQRGGALLGRLNFIRTLLNRYQMQKPILVNEGSLLCLNSDPHCFTETFLDAQANYVFQAAIRAWANGILGFGWYTLNDSNWNESGLMGKGGLAMRPAYHALKFLANTLHEAQYTSTFYFGALEGYSFRKGSLEYQIYWTNDASKVLFRLPKGIRAVYNRFGHDLTPRNLAPKAQTITISTEPVVLEIQP